MSLMSLCDVKDMPAISPISPRPPIHELVKANVDNEVFARVYLLVCEQNKSRTTRLDEELRSRLVSAHRLNPPLF